MKYCIYYSSQHGNIQMNKSIYIKDINNLLKQYRPGRFEPEYHEWLQNSDILLILAILSNNSSPELRKVSFDSLDILLENRWQVIAGSAACYTGDKPHSAVNKFFIALTQHIAKLFPERYSHYYKLLMPTATNLDEAFLTTYIAVKDTPLQDLFVADNQALVCISDTLEYAKRYYHLTKVESKTHPPLTLREKEQLLRDKNARELAMEYIHPPKELQVVNLSSETADQIRLLRIACLHGKGEISNQAIGNFFFYTKNLSAEEKLVLDEYLINPYPKFKSVFDLFIDNQICIYYAGNYFCMVAFDFIRDDAKWENSLPFMPDHEEAGFSKYIRDHLRNIRPKKICRDVYEKIDVTALKAEASVDEAQAREELQIIKVFIEQKSWNTFGTKTISLTLADNSSKIVPRSLQPVYEALIDAQKIDTVPINLLMSIKIRFQQRYFTDAHCKNPELLAFYRSFYTNNHIAYMQENLHPPAQQLEQVAIPEMEMK